MENLFCERRTLMASSSAIYLKGDIFTHSLIDFITDIS